jgi:hypothetical protein
VITKSIPGFSARRDLWYRIVDSSALSQLRNGQIEAAAETICAIIDEAMTASNRVQFRD